MKKVLVILFVVSLICGFAGTSMAGVVAFGSFGGHNYEVVNWDVPSVGGNWNAANAAASAGGGYLATITSAGEQTFIASLLNSYYTTPGVPLNNVHYWIGGSQTGTEPPFDAGWSWVTGEPWVYTSWQGGQPNQAAQDFLQISREFGWNWDDATLADGQGLTEILQAGYVREAVPESSTLLLLGSGLIGLVGYGRKRMKK